MRTNFKFYFLFIFISVFFVTIVLNLVLGGNRNLVTVPPASAPATTVIPTIIPVTNTPTITLPDKQLSSEVKLLTPKARSPIPNPVWIEGTIPRSWTFEATFRVEILDNNRKNIATAPIPVHFANETNEFGNFYLSIHYSTTATSGYIVLHNDNPSGLSENNKSYEIPVTFFNSITPSTSWLTYSNDDYGFEFQYPPSWQVEIFDKNQQSNRYTFSINNGSEINLCQNSPEVKNQKICDGVNLLTDSIRIVVIENINSINELFQKDNYYTQVQKTTFSGYPAYKSVYLSLRGSLNVILVQVDEKIYEISPIYQLNSSKINRILSSIKFTKTTSPRTMKVKIYQPPRDVSVSCESVDYVEVDLPRSSTPLKDSLNYLIGQLKNSKGFRLVSATINNGVATLKFDDPNFFSSGGSCWSGILSSQIEKTALQFPTVKSVKFSGPEWLFQP